MRYCLVLLVLFLSACKNGNDRLPIHGRHSIEDKTVDGKVVADTLYHTIPDFKLVDQDSVTITPATFDDKIYVADFFFTSCPSICPIMTSQMLRVYDKFKDNDEVLIISHSIDPTYDSVPVLKDYADKIGVSSDKWHFVTGVTDDIYDLAQLGYMVTAVPGKSISGDIMHSGAFVLVDKQKRVRGVYDGTKEDKVNLLMVDMQKLLKE